MLPLFSSIYYVASLCTMCSFLWLIGKIERPHARLEKGEICTCAAGLAESHKGDQALNDHKLVMDRTVDNKIWVEADKQKDEGEPRSLGM